MSNLGPIYEDDEHYSPARANAKAVLRDKGTNIVALATSKQLGLVCPTDTSGGLIKNVLYYVDYDSSFNRIGFEPVFHKHSHLEDTDVDGGRFLDMFSENISEFMEVAWVMHQATATDFWNFQTSGGSPTLTLVQTGGNSYHEIATTTTTGAMGTATMGGARYEFGDLINMIFQLDLDKNSNILVRTGLNIDRVQDSPSTSRRQMGLEGCDGHGTNWVMLNANGNSSSLVVTPTTAPLNTGGADNTYNLRHTPATTCEFYYNGTLNATSNTNIADDGSSERQRLFRWGVKLPTGSAEIKFRMFYVRIIGNQKILP